VIADLEARRDAVLADLERLGSELGAAVGEHRSTDAGAALTKPSAAAQGEGKPSAASRRDKPGAAGRGEGKRSTSSQGEGKPSAASPGAAKRPGAASSPKPEERAPTR
jgi:hypothetical protein